METVKKLLSSKKAVMALLGAIAWGAGRAGFDINPEDLYPIVGLLGLYVGSEAAVDMARAKSPTMAEAAKDGPFAAKPVGKK